MCPDRAGTPGHDVPDRPRLTARRSGIGRAVGVDVLEPDQLVEVGPAAWRDSRRGGSSAQRARAGLGGGVGLAEVARALGAELLLGQRRLVIAGGEALRGLAERLDGQLDRAARRARASRCGARRRRASRAGRRGRSASPWSATNSTAPQDELDVLLARRRTAASARTQPGLMPSLPRAISRAVALGARAVDAEQAVAVGAGAGAAGAVLDAEQVIEQHRHQVVVQALDVEREDGQAGQARAGPAARMRGWRASRSQAPRRPARSRARACASGPIISLTRKATPARMSPMIAGVPPSSRSSRRRV